MFGKTAEEMRIQFGIQNDFTPEEEAQTRTENKWCEVRFWVGKWVGGWVGDERLIFTC